MAKTIVGFGVLLCAAGCERADSLDATDAADLGPGVSFEREPARLSAKTVDRVEPPPPPTNDELRIERLRSWYASLSSSQQQGVSGTCRWLRHNPCAPFIMRRGETPDPRPELLATLTAHQRELVDPYCSATERAPGCETPLVVAFEDEPIAFADHWPTATTPWLAMDRDGDGAITSRAELFGDATEIAGRTATNGFEALAALDDNGDGVIDARDAAFGRLLLWADRDGDQRSSAGELRPAYEVVIAIPLANAMRGRCTVDGDCEGEAGELTWRAPDGSMRTGAVVDVYLPSR